MQVILIILYCLICILKAKRPSAQLIEQYLKNEKLLLNRLKKRRNKGMSVSRVRPIITEETREIREFFIQHRDNPEPQKYNLTGEGLQKSRTVHLWPNGSHCIMYCHYLNVTSEDIQLPEGMMNQIVDQLYVEPGNVQKVLELQSQIIEVQVELQHYQHNELNRINGTNETMLDFHLYELPLADRTYNTVLEEEHYLNEKDYLVVHMKNNNESFIETNALNALNIQQLEKNISEWKRAYQVRMDNKSDQANISMAMKEQVSQLHIQLDKPRAEIQLQCHRVPPPIIPMYTDILTVHLFMHSHMDLSWLDTFQETYLKYACPILVNVVESLQKNPERRFLISEVGFLQKAIEEGRVSGKTVRGLTDNGQIEIVNGGYGANDEATSYYEDIVDQMTYGLQYIWNTLGIKVETGWNIDSFGSTLMHSYLVERMGMTSMFTSRMNRQEREQMPHKSYSFVMQTDSIRFKQANRNIVHWNAHSYNYQQQIMLDAQWAKAHDRPFITIDHDNVQQQALNIIQYFRHLSDQLQFNDTLYFLLGDDFAYQESEPVYQQLEILMNYMNNNNELLVTTIEYSTPKIYLEQIEKEYSVYQQQEQERLRIIKEEEDRIRILKEEEEEEERIRILKEEEEIQLQKEKQMNETQEIEKLEDNASRFKVNSLLAKKLKRLNKDDEKSLNEQEQKEQEEKEKEEKERQLKEQEEKEEKEKEEKERQLKEKEEKEEKDRLALIKQEEDWIIQANKTLHIKQDDYLPYSDKKGEYWTGYYSSRPNLKHKIYQSGRLLQTMRTLLGLIYIKEGLQSTTLSVQQKNRMMNVVDQLEQTVALCQHHDSITGTSRYHVLTQLMQQLTDSTTRVFKYYLNLIDKVTSKLLGVSGDKVFTFMCDIGDTYLVTCPDVLVNLQKKSSVFVTVYNPTVARQLVLRVKIGSKVKLFVRRADNNQTVTSDIICHTLGNREDCELYFQANLNYYAYDMFIIDFLERDTPYVYTQQQNYTMKQKKHLFYKDKLNITSKLEVQLKDNELLVMQTNQKDNMRHSFRLGYYYYLNGGGGGAYVFDPQGEQFLYSTFNNYTIHKGKLVTVIQMWSQDIQVMVKYYNNLDGGNSFQKDLFEVNTQIIKAYENREVIMRVSNEDIKNKGEFYTDRNGLFMVKRILNYNKDYEMQIENEVSQNYVPVDKFIKVGDEYKELLVVNDRPQGGVSLAEGRIELLIQRSTSTDDNKGIEEALNEQDSIVLTHYVKIDYTKTDNTSIDQIARHIQLHTDVMPVITYGRISDDIQHLLNWNYYHQFNNHLFIYKDPLKLQIIFDKTQNFRDSHSLLLRVQNYQLYCGNSVLISNVDFVINNNLCFTSSDQQMVENYNRMIWMGEEWSQKEQVRVENGTAFIDLEKGLELHSYTIGLVKTQ